MERTWRQQNTLDYLDWYINGRKNYPKDIEKEELKKLTINGWVNFRRNQLGNVLAHIETKIVIVMSLN